MAETDENTTNTQQVPPTPSASHTLSTIKLPILKKEGLHKGYDRFQSLLSQLETHGAGVSLKMPIKSFLGLYLLPGPNTHNVAFVSSDNTSSTNEVNTAYGVSTSSDHNSQKESSSSYTDDLMYSFFSNQSSSPKLDHEILEQVDEFDFEEMDLKWQVAMISTRLKKFYKKTGRKLHFDANEPVGFDKSVDWTGHVDDETEDYALMAFNSSNSGSDTELTSCLKVCEESYAKLKKLYDEQRKQLGVASIEIQAYTLDDEVLIYENEVFASVFDSRSSDVEDSLVNDRFAKVKGMHAVPPLMTGNYMHPKSDFRIDESKFTYTSESNAKTSDLDSCDSNSSVETLESVPKPVANEPKAVSKPKVWSDAPIIEEDESDSDDEHVTILSKEQEKPSFAFANTVEHACFVCGSFSHLIRDCDFHEKRIAKQIELNKQKGESTGPKEYRLRWNNVKRLNHLNKFVPTAVLTKTGRFPVNVARQNFTSQTALTSTARKVNTATPKVNEIRPRHNAYKSHLPIRRPFYKTTASKANFAHHKVNTTRDKPVSAIGGKWETAVKASAGCSWETKDITRTESLNTIDNPHQTLKGKGIVDSGCSRHMTGNKTYLIDYQDFNGGPVAFGGSKGQITRKGKIKTGKLDFEDVYFVKELQHFNFFSVSQMFDKKNKVLFTDIECLVSSPNFKLPDENQVLLRVPRQYNMYDINLENIAHSGGLACLIAKATVDESTKWHRRMTIPVLLVIKEGNTRPPVKRDQEGIQFARTPQQNEVAERKNKTLIEAAKTMLADSFLSNTFWAKAVSTACYVLNRVFVTKPQNKTPYELLTGKFAEKSDEGILVRYSQSSKAFRVYNLETKRVKENLHINFLANKPNVGGKGPTWLFDLDYLTDLMNCQPLTKENKANNTAGSKETNNSAAQNGNEKLNEDTDSKTNEESVDQADQAFLEEFERLKRQEKEANDAADTLTKMFAQSTKDLLLQAGAARASNTNYVNTADISVNVASTPLNTASTPTNQDDSQIPTLEDIYDHSRDGIFTSASYDDEGVVDAFTNLDTTANKEKKDIMLVHVYADAIIFGSTRKSWCDEFEALMKNMFQMSSMGELTFFLGLQVKQKEDVCACSRFQITPKTSHLQAVKRIFRYLKGQPKLGLWHHFIRDAYEKKLIQVLKINTDDNVADLLTKAFDVSRIQALIDGKRVNIKESSIRHTLRLDDAKGTSSLTNVEIFEGLAKTGYEKPSDKLTFYKDFFSPQWKFLIHTILQCPSAKTTSWNEFSSTMESVIICLATNQKFNLSRYILLSLVKNIEAGVPFFMFPSAKTTSWNEFSSTMEYVIICLATNQKFNLSRYILLIPKEVGILQANTQSLSITNEPSTSKPQKKYKQKRKHTQESKVPLTESTAEQTLPSPSNDLLPSGKDSLKLKELMDLCTNLSNKVLELDSEVINIKFTYQERIEKLEGRVQRLEEENRVLKELKSAPSTDDAAELVIEKEKPSKQERKIADIDADIEINLEKTQVLSMMDVNEEEPADVEEVLEAVKAAKLMTEVVTTAGVTKVSVPKKRTGVIIQDPEETKIITATAQSKEVARQLQAELNADINWNGVIEQVKRNERLNDVVMKYQTLKMRPLTQAQARRNVIVYVKNMAGFKMDYFKGMTYDEIRPLFEKHYNYNQTFLDEVNKGVKVSETEVRQEKDAEVESSKREGESLEQKSAKKQKIEEETKELKKHLHIVTDDDVYIDATPLASKIPIIDFKIHTERNRPYFKIIRADGNHMLFISLSIMLKNFDREDLESLWIIVRDRFEKTKPKNYSDDYSLNTFKIMFEKPNVEASMWKDQKGIYGLAKVKSWKLIESCGVHCITFLTTWIFILVERMYPLTHFTLEQILNDVRLQVKEESEMSLELLRLVRRQLNEGYVPQ
nr:hypothetical protein [Tanacetum cinerariifolium]